MTPNPIALELTAIAARLRELFPESKAIHLEAETHSDGSPGLSCSLHQIGDYAAVTAMMQRIGLGEREKATFETGKRPWSTLTAEADGVEFTGFCDDLPPSCHIEQVVETVPEYAETGRTVTQTRNVVRCV